MLTDDEIKDVIKVMRPLENREILLKWTTEKLISQKGGLLSNYLGPLMKVGLKLMKNVLTPVAKSVLIPLGLTAASARDSASQKKIYGSGMTTLVNSNEEM